MAAATELATIACIRAACQELALSRASYYRKLHPGSPRRNVSLLDQHHVSHARRTRRIARTPQSVASSALPEARTDHYCSQSTVETKNSLNFASTCLKVVDTRRPANRAAEAACLALSRSESNTKTCQDCSFAALSFANRPINGALVFPFSNLE
jgi:hypothetical protein